MQVATAPFKLNRGMSFTQYVGTVPGASLLTLSRWLLDSEKRGEEWINRMDPFPAVRIEVRSSKGLVPDLKGAIHRPREYGRPFVATDLRIAPAVVGAALGCGKPGPANDQGTGQLQPRRASLAPARQDLLPGPRRIGQCESQRDDLRADSTSLQEDVLPKGICPVLVSPAPVQN